MRNLKKSLLAVVVSGALVAVASLAYAGAAAPRSATCSFNADGSGYCSGTLKAFRNSSDPTAQLIIQGYADSTYGQSNYINLYFAGKNKFVRITNATLNDMVMRASTALDSGFFVAWDKNAIATAIQLYNDSGLL